MQSEIANLTGNAILLHEHDSNNDKLFLRLLKVFIFKLKLLCTGLLKRWDCKDDRKLLNYANPTD